ncbi:MAG TPA: glycosyltransferase family 39 protein [Candidatus Saccharimonadaceae bacterium]|nr:glycosyltransferase family 39 protein [Candidatus Saccharimonadaceae bacterium]
MPPRTPASSKHRPRRPPPAQKSRKAPAWRLHGAPADPARDAPFARLGLWVVGAVAAGLAFMIVGPHRIGDYFTETDFYGAYAEGARQIAAGHLDPSRYGVIGPGYEVALALVGFAVRDLFLAAELLSLLSIVAALLLWRSLLTRRAGARVAGLAVLVMALNPYVFRYGYAASTDAFALALDALALWLLLAWRARAAALVAGAATALAFLTRYSAVAILPAALMAIAWGGRQGLGAGRHAGVADGSGDVAEAAAGRATSANAAAPRPGARRRDALLFVTGFLAPVVPWVLFSLAHGGRFSFQLHHNIAYEVFARSKGMVWDDYQKKLQPQFHNLWDVIRRDPPAVFAHMAFNVLDHVRLDAQQLLGWPLALAALAGALLVRSSGHARALLPVWLAGAWLSLSLVPAFYSERYALVLVPVYATLAALAMASPRFALERATGRGFAIKSALAALVLAACAWQSIQVQRRTLDQLPVEVLDAARALKQSARPGDKVIARKPHLSFHSGVAAVPFPFTDDLAGLAAAATRSGARWLYISWPEVETRPRYWYLMDTSAVVPGLTVRHVTAPHPSVLYEIGPGFGATPAWFANDTVLAWHTARAQLMVSPRLPTALFTLALVENSRGQLDSARVHLERAVEARPQYPEAWLLLGELRLRGEDAAGAADAYAHVLRIDPGSVDGMVGAGWAALLGGRTEEAARYWRPVVRATRDRETLNRMVQLFSILHDDAAAGAAAERFRELGPAR